MTVNELAHAEEHRIETWLYTRQALDPLVMAIAGAAVYLLVEVFVPTLKWLLLLSAFLSFGAAASGVTSRVNLVALGLALWVLTLLF